MRPPAPTIKSSDPQAAAKEKDWQQHAARMIFGCSTRTTSKPQKSTHSFLRSEARRNHVVACLKKMEPLILGTGLTVAYGASEFGKIVAPGLTNHDCQLGRLLPKIGINNEQWWYGWCRVSSNFLETHRCPFPIGWFMMNYYWNGYPLPKVAVLILGQRQYLQWVIHPETLCIGLLRLLAYFLKIACCYLLVMTNIAMENGHW